MTETLKQPLPVHTSTDTDSAEKILADIESAKQSQKPPLCKWCGRAGMLNSQGVCTFHDPALWSESPSPALERCPKCHLAYVEGGNQVCMADHTFEPNKQCSGTTCNICDETKEWHDKRDESLRYRRALMPDYDQRLKDWLS